MGWMHSSPEGLGGISRGEDIRKNTGEVPYPPLGPEGYLINKWISIGLAESGPMGPVALSSTEIMNWQAGSKNKLNPWEFLTIRKMSRTYCSSLSEAQRNDCLPPYGQPIIEELNRKKVAAQVSSSMKSFMQAFKK